MSKSAYAAAFLLGAAVGSTGMFGFGWWFSLPPVVPPPVEHRTRPAWDAPAPAADPLDLIPPTSLPTR